MTLVVRYVGISDAMSVDGRQALNLTNFDPTHFAFDTFPASWPVACIGIFEGDPGEEIGSPGTPFTAHVSVYDPHGRAIVTMPGAGTFAERPFPDLPPRFVVGLSMLLNFPEPGDYRLEIGVSAQGQSIAGSRTLFVRKPSRTA